MWLTEIVAFTNDKNEVSFLKDLDMDLTVYLDKAIKVAKSVDRFINGAEKELVLEVGSNTIKLIEFAVKSNSIEVTAGAVLNTPINSIENDRLIDINTIANILAQAIEKEKIKTKELVVSIVSKDIIIREMNVPNMREKDLKNFVQINSTDIFPVKLVNYVLGYNIIEKGATNRVMIAAVPKDILNGYIELAEKLGLNLKGFNYSGYELYNFLDFEIGTIKESYLAVDLGAKNTNIVIISNGVLKFNKIIPKGSEEINRDISEELNCTVTRAEQLKRHYNTLEIEKEIPQTIEEEIVAKYTRRCIDSVLQDIVRIIEFFNSNNAQNKIAKIYIIGTAGKIKAIDEYFTRKLNLPVTSLKNLSKVNFNKGALALKPRHHNFINCFGAHCLKENKFYFIKSDLKFKKLMFFVKTKFHKLMLCVSLIICLMLTAKITEIGKIQDKINMYNSYVAQHTDVLSLYDSIKSKEKEYDSKKSKIDGLGTGLESYINILDKTDIIINNLQTDANVYISKIEFSGTSKKILKITANIDLPEGIDEMDPNYYLYKNLQYEIVDNLKEEIDKKIDTTYSTRDGNMICTLSIDVTQ